ncbi:MAG: efflux RND transporter periplasmic adaptor subunit [Lachnospiraceae bacterium]
MKKIKSKKKIVIPVLVVAVIVLVAVIKMNTGKGDEIQSVDVAKVKKGTVTATLETSGMVDSEDTHNYVSPVNAKINTVSVQVGDTVKAGDYLLTYDTESLEKSYTISELESKAEGATRKKSLELSEKGKAQVAEAESKINASQANIDSLNGQLATLQSQLEAASGESADVSAIQSSISEVTKQLEDEQSRLEEAKAEKESASASVLTDAERQGIEYSQEAAKLTLSQSANALKDAKAGIIAESDGIVTAVTVSAGGMAEEGASMISVANTSSMCVDFQVSKHNLENLAVGQNVKIEWMDSTYEGVVSSISRTAQAAQSTNENAKSTATMTSAKVHINNPDDKLIIGLDAKLTIELGTAENVLYVPLAAVNTDSKGDFVYVLKDNIVEKKYVTTGMSSKNDIVITEGLKKGEEVITTIDSNIMDGMSAVANASDSEDEKE